jgi:hypothetical protein
VALLADALGIDVLLDFVLYWQLGQLLADVFPDFDQQRIARAVRAPAFGRVDRMLDPATGQMLRKAISPVWTGLALTSGQVL